MQTQVGTILAIAILFPAFAAAQESPRYPRYDDEDVQEMLSGDVKVSMRRGDGDTARGTALGLIQAPLEELAEIIRDFDHHEDWYPDMTTSTLSGDVGHGVINAPWPMTDRTWDITIESGDRTVSGHTCFASTYQHVPGSGNVTDTHGYWLLCPWSDDTSYTLVRYVLNMDPGVPVPDAMIRSSTRRMLPGVINGLREAHSDRF